MRNLFTLLLILFANNLFADFDYNDSTYRSIESGLKDPLRVKKLLLYNYGPIPKEIGQFKNLESLVITGNDMDFKLEVLPEEIYQLTKLKSFSITNTYIKTLSPNIRNLKNLEILIVGFNTKSPPEIGELENLKILVTHNLPEYLSFNNLKKLKELYVGTTYSVNQVSIYYPQQCENNKVNKILPNWVFEINSLEILEAYSIQCDSQIQLPETIFPNLKFLKTNSCVGLSKLKNCNQLDSLYLSCIDSAETYSLSYLTSLKKLKINYVTQPFLLFDNISELPNLIELEIYVPIGGYQDYDSTYYTKEIFDNYRNKYQSQKIFFPSLKRLPTPFYLNEFYTLFEKSNIEHIAIAQKGVIIPQSVISVKILGYGQKGELFSYYKDELKLMKELELINVAPEIIEIENFACLNHLKIIDKEGRYYNDQVIKILDQVFQLDSLKSLTFVSKLYRYGIEDSIVEYNFLNKKTSIEKLFLRTNVLLDFNDSLEFDFIFPNIKAMNFSCLNTCYNNYSLSQKEIYLLDNDRFLTSWCDKRYAVEMIYGISWCDYTYNSKIIFPNSKSFIDLYFKSIDIIPVIDWSSDD